MYRLQLGMYFWNKPVKKLNITIGKNNPDITLYLPTSIMIFFFSCLIEKTLLEGT